ncbi:MAG TPA: L,D-transpeptidase family protein [Syntrophobacter fumaroxidans]|nr:L,D-transpeptidase family protein [Syntrophobacter fumaroxidans]
MSTPSIQRPRVLSVLLVLLFLCCGSQCYAVPSEAVSRQEHGAAPSGGSAAEAALSSQWRSAIWETIPPEWLGSPTPNTILQAYQENEWTPFFITSTFELAQGAHALLRRAGEADKEAMDPKPLRIEEVRQHVKHLEQARDSAKALLPNLSDSIADLSGPSGEPPAAPGSPGIQPVNPAVVKAREERYRNLFRVAVEADVKLAELLVRFSSQMDPFSGEDQVKALSGRIPMNDYLKRLEPRSPHYRPLLNALARYRDLAANTTQQQVRAPSTMRPGESGNAVRDLQKRLQQEDFYRGEITGTFDAATQQAVKRFQAAHQIEPDGAVGQRTREWLNMPFKQKAEMIAHGINLLRQSQTRRSDRYVRINIPQFALEYYKDGQSLSSHRVIVGKASGKKVKVLGKWMRENQTPTLTSNIEQVIINPRWYVSDRIRLELDAQAGSDPQYFARHGYVQMASLYPWGQPRLFQKPGPKNPLGQIKFEFPNPYAVYLHDTNQKSLFQRTRRDFSHGCIRVEKAKHLAHLLLKDDQNPLADKTEPYLSSDRQLFIKLATPVPIIIEYLPVSCNEDGQVIFFGDPYGWLLENANAKG